MSRPILGISADWHIAEGAWRHRGVLGDARYSLEQFCRYLVAHEIHGIGAGDLYDVDDPSPASVQFVCRQLDELERRGRRLGFVVGQHERHRCGVPWLAVHDWPVHLDGGHTTMGDLAVWGVDWTAPADLPAKLAKVHPGVDLLVMHQVCREFMDINHEVVLEAIPGRMLIAVGDFHQARIIAAGEHSVISPGSFAVQSIDEEPQKSFVVLHDDGSLERVPLKSRDVAHYAVQAQDDLDRFLADRPWSSLLGRTDVPAEIRRPLVSVTFADDIPKAATRLAEALAQEVHYFAYPVGREARERAVLPVAAAPAGPASWGRYTLATARKQVIPDEAPVARPLDQLLAAKPGEVAQALAEIRREFLECREAGGDPA